MNLARALEACESMPAAERTYPFGAGTAVFKVRGKMFAVSREDEEPGRITLKCEPEYGVDLVQRHESITPGYHMNKRHWITVVLDAGAPASLIQELIEDSYDLVVASLPAARRPAGRPAEIATHPTESARSGQ
jgi:predicted DNA-binding protein (MmcQ/YjbR family)